MVLIPVTESQGSYLGNPVLSVPQKKSSHHLLVLSECKNSSCVIKSPLFAMYKRKLRTVNANQDANQYFDVVFEDKHFQTCSPRLSGKQRRDDTLQFKKDR